MCLLVFFINVYEVWLLFTIIMLIMIIIILTMDFIRADPLSGPSSVVALIELKFRSVGFCERRNQNQRTSIDLNS